MAADPIGVLDELADWSPWVPLTAATAAPRLPGVYRVREGTQGPLVYVGMAGPRAGRDGTKPPKGLHGRLAVYRSGKALTSGLGEALADRALADPAWLRDRLAEAEAGRPMRARDWGRATIERANPYVSWTVAADEASARALEDRCIAALADHHLWNRRR